LPPHHGHRTRPPLRGQLVANRTRPRLRARIHPPGGGPGECTGQQNGPDAVVPGRLGRPKSLGRRRGQRSQQQPMDHNQRKPSMNRKNALVVRGGWDGHQPVETTELFIPYLKANGYDVRVEESPAVYADPGYMATVDLIVQCNTMTT